VGGIGEALTALLDTNILIRHFTGEPKPQAKRAGRLLSSGDHLVLTELVVAECVFVLSSVYKLPPIAVASMLRTTIGFANIETPGESRLLRALELFADGHCFVDSFLVACAEESGAAVGSFDKGIDKIGTVRRIA
jgi:predicted nucleic acid-binding protein